MAHSSEIYLTFHLTSDRGIRETVNMHATDYSQLLARCRRH